MNNTKQPQSKTVCHIRWMIRRDYDYIIPIAQQSFPDPWEYRDFVYHQRQRDTIGMVAELNSDVVGYVVYELHKNRIQIINLAVDPKYRRSKIGKAMIDKLIGKLSHERRNRIIAEVRVDNLPDQLFFRSCGFRVERTEIHSETGEDFYCFKYRIGKDANDGPSSY